MTLYCFRGFSSTVIKNQFAPQPAHFRSALNCEQLSPSNKIALITRRLLAFANKPAHSVLSITDSGPRSRPHILSVWNVRGRQLFTFGHEKRLQIRVSHKVHNWCTMCSRCAILSHRGAPSSPFSSRLVPMHNFPGKRIC